MWILTNKNIEERLSYLKTIENFLTEDQVDRLLDSKPEKLREWIQRLRKYGDFEAKLTEVANIAVMLLRYFFENPQHQNRLIWLFKDLLGHDPLMFSHIEYTEAEIEIMLAQIQSNQYKAYPYVIMVRYVQPCKRFLFLEAIIDYADQSSDNMSWAMTGEACETLAFLNCDPEKSMRCMAKHLNDGGCDGYPADSILQSMHIFKQHGSIIIDELIKYMDEFAVEIGNTAFEVKCLS